MKSARKPIEVISLFDFEGNVSPIRFRYIDDHEIALVVSIDKVLKKDIDKFAGNKMLKFSCISNLNGLSKTYEIRYEIDTCRWFLYTTF
ncbi:MAG: hypothetical protein ACM3TR_19435 [Caulobacteraceae bacterium]